MQFTLHPEQIANKRVVGPHILTHAPHMIESLAQSQVLTSHQVGQHHRGRAGLADHAVDQEARGMAECADVIDKLKRSCKMHTHRLGNKILDDDAAKLARTT